jgi:hypothetical protein
MTLAAKTAIYVSREIKTEIAGLMRRQEALNTSLNSCFKVIQKHNLLGELTKQEEPV